MSIVNLTDRQTQQAVQQGRLVRLGTLSKGKREGFGRNIKLYDLPHFRFAPAEGFDNLEPLFTEVYGAEPTVIDDVRIPAALAGNFNIEDCAWLTAGKHTEKGSIFLARSDGQWVYQARGNDGKVGRYETGQLAYADITSQDPAGRDCFPYNGKLYPWQQTMTLDLILPKFSRLIFGNGTAGHGVVTLITHSKNDITSLIAEYYAMIDEIAGLLANPLRDELDRVKRYLPIRDFPIRLYRAAQTISTPSFGKDADPAERVITTKSLLHWQLAPDIAAAMQQARDAKTYRLIEAVAYMHQLSPGDPVARANADLFGDRLTGVSPHTAQLPAGNGYRPEQSGPTALTIDLDAILTTDDPAAEEVEVVEVEPYDWKEAALTATTLDGWAMAAYELHPAVFANATAVRKAYTHMFGKWDPTHSEPAVAAIGRYAQQVADGVKKAEAVQNAKSFFDFLLEADEVEGEEEE